jgi:hypothetical protein
MIKIFLFWVLEVFLEKMVEDAFDKMLEKRQHSVLYPHLCTLEFHAQNFTMMV